YRKRAGLSPLGSRPDESEPDVVVEHHIGAMDAALAELDPHIAGRGAGRARPPIAQGGAPDEVHAARDPAQPGSREIAEFDVLADGARERADALASPSLLDQRAARQIAHAHETGRREIRGEFAVLSI